MARLPRLIIPGQVHHVLQRGNNGQPIFSRPADYAFMVDILAEQLQRLDIALHAYTLMGNHFHLLLTPRQRTVCSNCCKLLAEAMCALLQSAQWAQWHAMGRALSLYRVTSGRYLLPCMAYLDRNPVQAGLVAQPDDYPWSSYCHYIGRRVDRLVRPHALYWALGNTPFAREARYSELVAAGDDPEVREILTSATQKGWALGDPEFLVAMQKATPRRLNPLPAGRRPGKTRP